MLLWHYWKMAVSLYVDNDHELFFYRSISWRVFKVSLVNDPNSQVGKVEVLTPIQINTTIPSWNQGVLDVPALTFDYGLHKFVFRFQVWSFFCYSFPYIILDCEECYNWWKSSSTCFDHTFIFWLGFELGQQLPTCRVSLGLFGFSIQSKSTFHNGLRIKSKSNHNQTNKH